MNSLSRSRFSTFPTQAFTLIELLTVIAIIGILAAIIIPTVGKVRTSAKAAKCSATLREWGRAIMLFSSDNKGTYTLYGLRANGTPASFGWQDAGTNPYTRYMSNVSDIVESSRAFRGCPLNSLTNINGVWTSTADYAMTLGSIDGAIGTLAPDRRVPLSKARNPSMYLLMLDCINTTTTGESLYISAETARIDKFVRPMFNQGMAPSGFEQAAGRHGGKTINAVFADGSVKRVTGTPAGQGDRNSILEMRTVWLQLY